MSAKVIFIASCSLLVASVSAKPHVLAGPAFVTAQSSQVFARTYNGIVPVAVHAPAPIPVPAVPVAPVAPAPAVFVSHLPAPAPAPVFSYQVYQPPAPVIVPVAVPATPAVPAAAAVVAQPAAKLVRKSAPHLTTIRYRTVLA